MQTLRLHTTRKDEVIDITDDIEAQLDEQMTGVCSISVLHTTCAITTADLDPGTDLDLLDAIRKIIPPMHFRHPHDPSHTPDHILSSILGTSITIPVIKGKLVLGVWQRIVLIELDGPRERNVVLTTLHE